ncbi:hypothetical protein VTK56DRAFT_7619 [Thermocarpiscus australiensis]
MAPQFFKKRKEADTAKTGEQWQSAAASATPPTATSDSGKPSAEPLLHDEDAQFLERLVSNEEDEEGPPPPLPPRPKTPDLTWDSDSDSFRASSTTEADTPKKEHQSRLSRLLHRKKPPNSLAIPPNIPPREADREWADLTRVLSNLDIAPSKTRPVATTASAEVKNLFRQFVLVLKDIARGAPTAVDDLAALLDGRNDALKRGFEKLPGSMQKLVTQLPRKLTSALGPEVLAAAAEAQGLGRDGDNKDAGLARFLMPRNLAELTMTPAIVRSMLKAIVNALKVRWPAFVGTNVLWSAAVFVLLFVLWYCHKRGREEREKLEKAEAEGMGEELVDGSDSVSPVVVESPAEAASRS